MSDEQLIEQLSKLGSGITPEQSAQWGRADGYARITKRAQELEAQLAAATQRTQEANQYALGMEEAANAVRAQNAALLQEIAGLRYYIAQLERNVSREDRAYAAEVASLMFAQHDSDSAQPRE